MSERQQPWSDEHPDRGRILLLSDNPVSQPMASIAGAVGRGGRTGGPTRG